jgi:hypothetical protein
VFEPMQSVVGPICCCDMPPKACSYLSGDSAAPMSSCNCKRRDQTHRHAYLRKLWTADRTVSKACNLRTGGGGQTIEWDVAAIVAGPQPGGKTFR